MTPESLSEKEFDPYYGRYINKLDANTDLVEGFESGLGRVSRFFSNVAPEKQLSQYAPGKWTIKEVLQHLIDTERIFMYRCFRIARRDTQALAGYNQEIYVAPSGANDKSMESLVTEFRIGRDHSIALLKSLSEDDLSFIGTASGNPMSARAAAFTIIGHDIWHMDIIQEKYL